VNGNIECRGHLNDDTEKGVKDSTCIGKRTDEHVSSDQAAETIGRGRDGLVLRLPRACRFSERAAGDDAK
jgi:hypothetical protein